MSLGPVAPHHNRLGALAALHPRLWFWQHLDDARSCWCDDDAPDPRCDTGWSLWRLAHAPDLKAGPSPRPWLCLCRTCLKGAPA